MTGSKLLKYRLPVLFCLLVALETVNLVKLSIAMAWTNGTSLGIVAAIALGAFLLGSVLALSFDLNRSVKTRLELLVVLLFVVQTSLVCLVSYLHSLALMPASEVATLFGTPVEATRKVVALAEGAVINLAAFGFWTVSGSEWRRELEAQRTQRKDQLKQLADLDAAINKTGGNSNAE